MSTKIFDAYAAYYDMIYRDKDYIGESRYVEKALKRRGVDGPRLLELGCGTGRHAVCLARAGYRIHGIDLSAHMVQQANAQMPKDLADRLVFEQGDVRSARLPGHLGSFDAVIALFMRAPNVETLPMRIYSTLEFSPNPSVAAVSTVMILMTIVLVMLLNRIFGLSNIV